MESAQDLIVDHCRPPTHFYIDIGNVCNLRCPFCVTGAGINNQSQGLMSLASFEIILAKIRNHAQLISLYNWGEPLLNKSLVPMIRLVAASGIRAHIDTNLAVRDIDNDEAVGIVSSGLHSLFASIDGITQATYEKYRVRGKLNRVFANLQRTLGGEAAVVVANPVFRLAVSCPSLQRARNRKRESARKSDRRAHRVQISLIMGPKMACDIIRCRRQSNVCRTFGMV
jgi:MoaA/NifB/PqqE/SkfB family radical SAM enzyme